MNNDILKIEGLVKSYDNFTLGKIDLNIPRGYIMGFVGRNGAGKSTTIKCIMNLLSCEEGRIEIFGLDNRKNEIEVKNKIGYVSEEQYFYEEMSVEWTGKFIGGFYTDWDSRYFDELLKKFDIDKKKKVKELSKGMKMKLSLACAIAHHPELLILDEPTSGLDPVIRNEILEMFLDIIQDENCSIFFSSHITSDIEKVADFVTIIDNGQILLSEDKDLLIDKWKIIKSENTYMNDKLQERLIGIKKSEFGFSGATDDIVGFAKQFRSMFPDGSFKTEKITLDELLLRLVRQVDIKS